ncbi:hypothetical protein [Haemophilus haemolyticus]|nr:hypothetical protein [Haemophilus haemolyticus]
MSNVNNEQLLNKIDSLMKELVLITRQLNEKIDEKLEQKYEKAA